MTQAMTVQNKKNIRKNRKGFTLIELIVVIAILAILAAIAIPAFAGSLNNAKKQAHNANVRTIQSAVELYLVENPSVARDAMDDIDTLVSDYLTEVPTVPDHPSLSGTYEVTNGVVSPAELS